MVVRGALISLMLATLAGCAVWKGMKPTTLAADCPSVQRASAWVDRMPKVGATPHKLIVAVQVDDSRSWLLVPMPSEKIGLLVLNMVPGGPAVPGTGAYHESSSTQERRAVSIVCGRAERAHIDEITIAM